MQFFKRKSKNPSIEKTVASRELDRKKIATPVPNAPRPLRFFEKKMPTVNVKGALKNDQAPILSYIVMVYRMSAQAMNTLRSLHHDYQSGINPDEYEVIVVENPSDDMLRADQVTSLGPQFSYYAYPETGTSPVPAMNFAATKAKGSYLALMIDGARMLTPGVSALMHHIASSDAIPVVAVPGYHLGTKTQQHAMLEGYDQKEEAQLLASIQWPKSGYDLFNIACQSMTSRAGVFKPMAETNCLGISKNLYNELGGFDPEFDESGGGQVNLDLYKRAVEHNGSCLYVLPGEGSFHQFHGGVTTGTKGDIRYQIMVDHFAQYTRLRGETYIPPAKRPLYFGAIPQQALRFIREGAILAHNDEVNEH